MNTYGFVLVREEHLSEVGGTATLWKHEVTGAELLSVSNKDENKCFGVTLRTPSDNSTGVAHILEHSVLCGSEKYPVKEPFVELLKGSLQTFLNAFTFPDKTCYPVASANLQDFYNLVDVYLDAVFFPRITPEIFQQEGWHVEADDDTGPLNYKGVVFNEMKGVYSSADSVLAEASQNAVFPDTLYSLDSGGDPEVILKLTYKAFKDFHTNLYNPSNARFFFWGDDPIEKRFALLAPYVDRFTLQTPNSDVPLQKRRETPLLVEKTFVASEEDEEGKGHTTVNWLLCETTEIEEILMLEALEHILQGLPGSPLRRALIESGLGEDIVGGLETDLRQSFYSVGLRSIDPAKASDVECLILDTLAELAENGIPTEAVDAALNSLEFHLRENNTGSFPRGIAAMVQCLSTWLYDGDPFGPLAWEAPLAHLKTRLANKEHVFEEAITRWFLDNNHRATVVLVPDTTLAARRQAMEQEKLTNLADRLSSADRQELVEHTKALREAQKTPDSPADLALIPGLTLSDLPLKNTLIPTNYEQAGPVQVLLHPLDTTGVVYASLALSLEAVPAHLMPLVPLWCRALTEMGTSKRDFVQLGTRIASHTGGLGAGPSFVTRALDKQTLGHVHVGGKATAEKAQALFDLLAEILLEPNFDQPERFMQMVLEARARKEQGLIPRGHGVVASRLKSRHSVAGWLEEQMGGVESLFYVRALAERVSNDWASVLADLRYLHERIVRTNNALANITADSNALHTVLPKVQTIVNMLPKQDFQAAPWSMGACPSLQEALLVPAQVNYVGKGGSIFSQGYQWHGSAQVITRHLRMAWLWDQVRVQGGAYGAFCSIDRITGAFAQISYRDPNIENTLAVYDGASNWLRHLQLDDRELTRAIVGAIGDIDAYQLPDAKGNTALFRHLLGESDDVRQRLRDEVLSTTNKHFTEFAGTLEAATQGAAICALGGSDLQAVATDKGWSTITLL